MKVFQVSDFHFGIHSLHYEKWLNTMTTYCYDFLIPLLKKYSKKNDALIVLGDVFDNRTSINVKVLNKVVLIFEDIAKIINTHIIIGNHDCFLRDDTSINAVVSIRNIPNITLYHEPTIIKLGSKDALLCPWVEGKREELEILQKYSGADFLFTHSDLVGARTQVNPTRPLNRHVCSISDFSGYNRVYSGHIHIRQTVKNFTFVGAPYHLDRNDIGNVKGVYVLDTEKNEDIFIENNISPEFKIVNINSDSELSGFNPKILDNNYVDLRINNELLVKDIKNRLIIDTLLRKHQFESVEYVDNVTESEPNVLENVEYTDALSFDLERLSKLCVDSKKYGEDNDFDKNTKTEVKTVIEKAFSIHRNSNS